MRILRLSFILPILCLVSTSASAQQVTSSAASSTTGDPQAVALIQRTLAALTRGLPVSDVTLTGTAQRIAGSDDETGTGTLTAMATGDSKVSLNFPSGLRSEIRNPSGTPLPGALPAASPAAAMQVTQPVGAWSGPDGSLHPIVNHNLVTDATWFFPAFTISNVLSQAYVLSYIGPETLSGQAVVHICATKQFPALSSAPAQLATLLPHLSQMDVYLDATTLLPVALAFNVHPDTNSLIDIAQLIGFSSYQTVNGVQIPFHVQRYLNNSLALDLQFSSASLNSGLAVAAFQIQ